MSILASTGIQILRNETNIGGIFGGALALILGPYLITMFVKYLNNSFKWSFTEKSFLVTFTIVWCIFILLNITGTMGN
jgi:hypothetical protein